MLKVGSFFKRHLKSFIILAIIIALIIFFVNSSNKAKNMPMEVDTLVLAQGELVNSVNVSGTVESENSKKIYTQLTLPVLENHVEIGDSVKAGDVLCELDVESIESTIAQQKASANSSSAINQNSIALAQKQYQDALDDLSGDKNGSIATAEQAVVQAENALSQAEIAYDGAIISVTRARENHQYDASDYNRSALDSAINGRDQAYNSYESAKTSVAMAKDNLETAKNQVNRQITSYEDGIKTSKISSSTTNSQWIAIENLESDLGKATIASPINGVVTAVYVTEGATATGLLYVVEDIKDLKISASLKEYDLAFVKNGNPVDIESDATGDSIYSGKVDYIAPTTSKTVTGDNVIGATGEFKTEIKVSEKNTDLKIGSKARVDIVYERKDGIITVPLDAFSSDELGAPIVFALEPIEGEDGIYLTKAVPVEIGMEGAFNIEILSSDLKEGDIIIRSARNIAPGMRVAPKAASASATGSDASEDTTQNSTTVMIGGRVGAALPLMVGLLNRGV